MTPICWCTFKERKKCYKAEFKAQISDWILQGGGVTKSGHWVYMACIIELLIHLKQLKPVTKTKTFPWIQLTQERMFIETTKKPSLKWAVTYLKFTHNSAHSSCKSQHTAWTWLLQFKGTVFGEKKKKKAGSGWYTTWHELHLSHWEPLITKVNNIHSAGFGPTEAEILSFLIKGKSESCRKITTHIAS